MGLFAKITESTQLFDPPLEILELAKGEFTTAPQGHSGMGNFVSSRMMDGFAIDSPHTANEVYLKFFEPSEVGSDAYHTTEIPVRLAHPHIQLKTVGMTPTVAQLVGLFVRP